MRWLLIIVALAISFYVFLLARMLPALVGLNFSLKLLLSGILLVPLGFAMGMPFPTGLHALGNNSETVSGNSIEWAWAVNAASSVLGSVLAIVIALQFGLNVTLACGAVAYLSALLFARSVGAANA